MRERLRENEANFGRELGDLRSIYVRGRAFARRSGLWPAKAGNRRTTERANNNTAGWVRKGFGMIRSGNDEERQQAGRLFNAAGARRPRRAPKIFYCDSRRIPSKSWRRNGGGKHFLARIIS